MSTGAEGSASSRTALPPSLLTPPPRRGAGHFLGLRWSSESTLTVFNAAPPPPPQSHQPGYDGFVKRGDDDGDAAAHDSSAPPQQHAPGTKCPLAEIHLSSLEDPRHGYARALHARGHAIFSWLQRRQQQEWLERAPPQRQFATLLAASSRFREALRRCTQEAQQMLELRDRGAVPGGGASAHVEAEHLLARTFIAERSWALAELCLLHPDGIAAAVVNSAAGNAPPAAAGLGSDGHGMSGLNGPITPRGGLMDRQDTAALDVPATAGPRGAAVAQWIRQTYHSENEGGGEWEASSQKLVGEMAMRFARPQAQDPLLGGDGDGGDDGMDMDVAAVASVLELAHLCAAQLRVEQSAEEAEAEAAHDAQAPLHRDLLRRLFWPIVLMFVRRGDLRWAAGILLAAVPEDQLHGGGGDGHLYGDGYGHGGGRDMDDGTGSSFSWRIAQQTAQLLDTAPQELHGADHDAIAANFGDRWAQWRRQCATLLRRARSSLPDASDMDGMSAPNAAWVRGGHAAHPILDGAALRRGAGAVLRLLAGPDAAMDPGVGAGASVTDEPGFELDRFAAAAVAVHSAACAGASNQPDVRELSPDAADWHERLCARLLFYAADCGAATLAREARTATGGPDADGNVFSQAYVALLEGDVGICLRTLRHGEHGLLWAETHLTDLMHRADTIRRAEISASPNPSSVVWVPLIPEFDADMDEEMQGASSKGTSALDGLCLRDWLLLQHAAHLAASMSGGWQQSLNYVRAVLHDALAHDARGAQESTTGTAAESESQEVARQSALWQGAALLETVVERHEPGCDNTTEKLLHALGAVAPSSTAPALAHGSHGAEPDAGRSVVAEDAAVATAALLSAGTEAGCAAVGASCARAVCLGRARQLLGGRDAGSLVQVDEPGSRLVTGIEGAAAAAAWLGRAVLMPVRDSGGVPQQQPQAERLLMALIDKLLRASLAEAALFAANADANARGAYSVNGDALRRTVEALKPVAEAMPSGNTALPSEVTRAISTLHACVEMLQALSQRHLLQSAASTPDGAHLDAHIGHLTSRAVRAACALLGVGVSVDGVAGPEAAEVLLPVAMWLPVLQLLLLLLDADADADADAAAVDARPTLLASHAHALLARLQTALNVHGADVGEQAQTTGGRAEDSAPVGAAAAPNARILQKGLAQVAARATLSPCGVVDMF